MKFQSNGGLVYLAKTLGQVNKINPLIILGNKIREACHPY